MANPTSGDWARLKRAAKYALGAWRIVVAFVWQDPPSFIGCTRTATGPAVVILGAPPLELALSSGSTSSKLTRGHEPTWLYATARLSCMPSWLRRRRELACVQWRTTLVKSMCHVLVLTPVPLMALLPERVSAVCGISTPNRCGCKTRFGNAAPQFTRSPGQRTRGIS